MCRPTRLCYTRGDRTSGLLLATPGTSVSHEQERPNPGESGFEGSSFRLLDASEVAAMLGVRVRWVREATRDGRLPVVLGNHGRTAEHIAWWLLGEGTVSLVASDAHGAGRLPVLDVAREAIAERLGSDVADPLFNGRALQLSDD